MFDLRSARYFVAVAEELHFGRAAARLQMSQPPLSQAIRQLERDVGTTLFERTNRRVALTPAGSAFLSDCRALLQHADRVAETPRLAAAGTTARITVGTVASALTWPLPEALAILRDGEPLIDVQIKEIDTDEAAPSLLGGRIDVAVARLSTSQSGIRTQVLLRDEFVALLPSDHPLARGSGELRLDRLADDRWIWLPREISPDYHDEMAAACRASGFSPRVSHWARSIASQIALVHCGVGVTIIPQSAAVELPDRIQARAVHGPREAVTLAVSTRTARQPAEDLCVRLIESVVLAAADPLGPARSDLGSARPPAQQPVDEQR